VSEAEKLALAQQISEALGENEEQPRRQISEIVEHCGVEFAQSLLQETLETEANGGLMLPDQTRRRTVGGVFFYLARGKMPREIVKRVFPHYFKQKQKGDKTAQPIVPAFKWTERVEIVKALRDETGVLNTVKITLIGRPGKIDTSRKDLVITTMSHTAKSPTLPKGVPTPPDTPTLYTVYIAAKQWRKIETAIADAEDALIIEGTCAFDDQIGGMAVFALNVTTKQTEAKKRQQQREAAPEAQQPPTTQASTPEPVQPPPPAPRSALPNAPADVSQKLSGLYASASLFRQKIVAIQAKPAGQQSGLEMTQKLLKNVENEIAELEKKYGG
jgi:hypothetical protein